MRDFSSLIVGIIVVAIIAVIVSKNAATVSAIQTATASFNRILGVVVSPIAPPK